MKYFNSLLITYVSNISPFVIICLSFIYALLKRSIVLSKGKNKNVDLAMLHFTHRTASYLGMWGRPVSVIEKHKFLLLSSFKLLKITSPKVAQSQNYFEEMWGTPSAIQI